MEIFPSNSCGNYYKVIIFFIKILRCGICYPNLTETSIPVTRSHCDQLSHTQTTSSGILAIFNFSILT